MNRLYTIVRAYPTLLRIGLAEAIAYRAEFIVWMLTTTLPLIMLVVFAAAAREAPIGRFGQADFAAYYLATLIVRQMTGAWVVWELTMEIRQGTLPLKLLRPLHPLIAYSAENLAAIPMRAAIAVPIAVVMLIFTGRAHFTHDPLQLFTFLVALCGAWLLQFAFMSIIGTLGMYIESALAVFDLWMGLFAVLSGYLVPLELFPHWVQKVANVLPFRYMLGFPVELLTGGLTRGGALRQLGLQWAWAGAALLGARALWRAGTRRYEAYGG